MKEIEMSAKTVEEAIKLALEELGTSREEVEVDVLSEGSHGLLGIGAEDARVRVSLLEPAPSEADSEPTGLEPAPSEADSEPTGLEPTPPEADSEPTGPEPGQEREIVGLTRRILETVLDKMGVAASVAFDTEAAVQEAERASPPIVFNIEGDDLGILIGRRGQTLACLQYIVRIMVAQEMKAPTPVIVIDVSGYKQRRYQTLQALAQRLAEQVAATGNPFPLEPMPAYERRIIHLALSDHPDVTTESIGINEARKVVILLKGQETSAME